MLSTTAAAVLMLVAQASAAEPPTVPVPTIDVGQGRQRAVTLEGTIRRFSIGDEGIADLKQLSAHELLIVGVSKGQTTMLIWTQGDKRESYLVRVEPRDTVAELERLKPLLSGIEGLSVRIEGDELFIVGVAPTLEQENELRAVLLDFPDVHLLPMCRGGVQLGSVYNKERRDRERAESDHSQALKQHRLKRARCGGASSAISACSRSCR